MRLFAWNRLDAVAGRPFLWVTVAWCRLTGLSQHTLARAVLLGGIGANLVWDLLTDHPGWALAFGLGILTYLAWWTLWQFVPTWEVSAEALDLSSVLPSAVVRFRFLRWMRPLAVLVVAVNVATLDGIATTVDVLTVLGMYAVTVYGPRKPAVWRAALDRARSVRLGWSAG